MQFFFCASSGCAHAGAKACKRSRSRRGARCFMQASRGRGGAPLGYHQDNGTESARVDARAPPHARCTPEDPHAVHRHRRRPDRAQSRRRRRRRHLELARLRRSLEVLRAVRARRRSGGSGPTSRASTSGARWSGWKRRRPTAARKTWRRSAWTRARAARRKSSAGRFGRLVSRASSTAPRLALDALFANLASTPRV